MAINGNGRHGGSRLHGVSLTVLDVGARGGLHRRWHHPVVSVHGVGFDADAEECERLTARADGMTYLPYALGAADDAPATLRLTRPPGATSLLEPNREVLDQFPYGRTITVEREVPLTLLTLDTACARHGLAPDVIKVDIQGAELDVLRGGVRTLAGAFLMESEVEFQPLYVGQPLFRDLDAFMAQQGWTLLGLRRTFWRRAEAPSADGGTLAHGDALYLNPARVAAATAATVLPLMFALAAYRQADYVAHLARRFGLVDVVPLLVRSPTWSQRLAGAVMSRLGPHRSWRVWLDGCRPSGAIDWHDPEDFF